MKRTIQIFVEGIKGSNGYNQIELFKDESIHTSLSVQNIADISKIYTDFTQSFTVPCTPTNNAIFKHFYNSDVDCAEDFGVRKNAYIEIDYTPFRSGRIQLESSELTNNRADYYTLTFYGNTLSIKDTIKNDKLSSLNYNNLLNPFTGVEVKNRVTDGATDYDVRYPLISSSRLWSYNDATSTDIKTSGGRLVFSELSPAVKISKIIEAIETKYSIDFQGVFMTDKRFTNCFLLCKNALSTNAFLHNKPVLFGSNSDQYPFPTSHYSVDYATNSINYAYEPVINVNSRHQIRFAVTLLTVPTANYIIDVYENGVYIQSIPGTGISNQLIYNDLNDPSLNKSLSFTFRSDVTTTAIINISYKVHALLAGNWIDNDVVSIDCVPLVSSSNLDLAVNVPDMEIVDFLQGVFKEFNLTCYPLNANTFQVEPLDSWYGKGQIRDITTFVDEKSITIERVPRYKKVSFNRQSSQSFMNTKFKALYNKEYGDLDSSYSDGEGEYIVSLPFESLMFNRFTSTQLQVGYCLNNDYKSYVPKPVLLYMYDSQPCNFKFFNGSAESTITAYQPFGQDIKVSGINYSLNFGSDTSTLLNTAISNSIYSDYYSGYLTNIFNKKNRITKCDAIFPVSLITGLRLNDRLIIRDHRFIINEINTDITTGLVKLVLIHDFRTIPRAWWKGEGKLSNGGGVFGLPILKGNDVRSIGITTTTAGVTFSTATIYEDTIVDVTYPANPNPKNFFLAENGTDRLMDEKLIQLRSEIGTELNVDVILTMTIDTKAPHNRLLSETSDFLLDEEGNYLLEEPETTVIEIINLNQA